MNTQDILDPERWAKKTFGSSQLNDIRRTGRAVKAATLMAENPSASLPAHMQTWKGTMGLYRLLDEDDVTFEALMQPHWQQTRDQLETRPVVLRVLDTTEVDLSHHPKTKGLGQVGHERGRGLYLPAGAGRPAAQRRGGGRCDARTLCAYASPGRRDAEPADGNEANGKRMCGCAR